MSGGFGGEFQFGSYPVGACDEYGLAVAVRWQLEKATEATQPFKYARATGTLSHWFDYVHEAIASLNVDPRVPVAKALRCVVVHGLVCYRCPQGGANLDLGSMLA